MMIVWVLCDERIGSVKQAIALANIMSWDYIKKDLKYTCFVKTPNFLSVFDKLSVDRALLQELILAPKPDVVISSGRRAARVSRLLKKSYFPTAKTIQILDPQMSFAHFDLVLLPKHDLFERNISNVLVFDGAIAYFSQDEKKQMLSYWKDFWNYLPQLKVALFIGGDSKNIKFQESHIIDLLNQTGKLAKTLGAGLLVTASRRTSASNMAIVKDMLAKLEIPYYFYEYGSVDENPYFGMLSCSECVIVTGDSISMCAESVVFGKKTYIYADVLEKSKKHQRFVNELIALSYAVLLKDFEAYPVANSYVDVNRSLRDAVLLKLGLNG